MIPGLSPREPVITQLSDGIVFRLIVPETAYTREEVDSVCRQLRQDGYHSGIIYRYVNRINGRGYIGQTIHPNNRHSNHLINAKKKYPEGVWGKALKRWGISCFDYYILDIKSDKNETRLHELLDESEKHYIKWYHTSVKEWGYNIASGGWAPPSQSSIEKAVDMFDTDGNFIRTFDSITQAKEQFGFSGPTIRQVCNHKHYSAGGYLWAWHGKLPIIPPDASIFAYNDNGKFVGEYPNAFVASKVLNLGNGSIHAALKDKHRTAAGMYWRTYKTDVIPLSDFPKAVYAYDTNGNFVRGFINLAKAKEFVNDSASSSISHAIIRKTAHKGYLWRTEYADHIDPSDGRFINKVAVIAIFPDGTRKRYNMIKTAAKETRTHASGIQHSIKNGTKTITGIQFIRANE